MDYLRQMGALIWKDVVVELRTRERVAAMGGFTVLVGVLFNYAIDPTVVEPQDIASGLIWMTMVFGGMLGFGPDLSAGGGGRSLPGNPPEPHSQGCPLPWEGGREFHSSRR